MKNKVIAILEKRSQEQLANLIKKNGGIPFLAPAVEEQPFIDKDELINIINKWDLHKPDIFIFQTGSGVKFLFEAVRNTEMMEKFLHYIKKSIIIVRSIKPAAALKLYNIKPTNYAKEPFTTKEVIQELLKYEIKNKNIVIQNYGDKNEVLIKTVEENGGIVTEFTSYKWSLPSDKKPLINLIDALDNNEIDVVAFTSASQVNNMFLVSEMVNKKVNLEKGLNKTYVVSIGPVCTTALQNYGIKVTKESNPPKLVNLIDSIKEIFRQEHNPK